MIEFLKTPTAIIDYGLIWTDNLAGDTIASATWTVPAGLTKDGESFTTNQSNVRLRGGTIDTSYNCKCHIATAGGRENERIVTIKVAQYIVVGEVTKRPGAIIDYSLDWLTRYIQSDSIVSHSWSAPGLSIVGASNLVTVRLSGSTIGAFYATDHVVMLSGQEDDRSILVVVRDV